MKVSGKRLTISQVPVPVFGQADGMDRTLAVAQAVAEMTGTTVKLPEDWELVEIDTDTGQVVEDAAGATRAAREQGESRGRRH